jgi:DNA-nicking Smr family endonuclease
MKHPLSREERALWRSAMREVRPLAGARTVPEMPEPPPVIERRAPAPAAQPAAAGLDRRSAQKLKRGQMQIAARLDLHGMTQSQAHAALTRFLERSQAAGQRTLLVITGKGGEGILRRAVPRWLAEPASRSRVLAVEEARPQHGGGGALYVLLRKPR